MPRALRNQTATVRLGTGQVTNENYLVGIVCRGASHYRQFVRCVLEVCEPQHARPVSLCFLAFYNLRKLHQAINANYVSA
jgi:hypothetical protein